jgi:MFS family permease
MSTQLSHQRLHPGTATWKTDERPRRLARVLAAVISGLVASVAIVPAAFATPIPIGDQGAPTTPVPPPTVRVVTTGGMAGWQITLIAVGAAVAAAVVAVLLDRKLASRRGPTAATARSAHPTPQARRA